MPQNRFIPLFSTQSGAIPTASALYEGELAVNIADGRLFTRSGSSVVLLNNGVSASYALTASYALNAQSGGSGGGSPLVNIDTYTFVGDGTTTNYILSSSYSLNALEVNVDGLTYTKTIDYSVTGATFSFVSAPPSESNILIRAFVNYSENGSASGSFSGSFTGSSSFTALPNITIKVDNHAYVGNGSTTNYTLSQSYDENVLFVSVDGLSNTLVEDFSVSGVTLQFVTAPPSQSNILVKGIRLALV